MQLAARTEGQTEEFGARLALRRPQAAQFAVVFLEGGLGAGKTTLVRGFLRAAGVTAAVRSPTYTLIELYSLPQLTVVHADLYRLRDPAELDALGLRDYAQAGYLWLIEWPGQGEGHLPPPDLTVRLAVRAQDHQIGCEAHSALGRAWLGALHGD